MTDYKPIAHQLARVRRTWKRTSALAGLAVTVLETTGLFTVMLLVDLLFRPGLQGRVVLLGLLVVAALVFLVRHALKPLFRHIPDEQVALYIEENNPGFEGALIAAAEFGRSGDDAIVSTILNEAERRASRFDVRSVTAKIAPWKYVWSSAAVLAFYALAGWIFPSTVGQHALRVMAPWRADKPAPGAVAPVRPPVKPDIQFTLSATNADILRGSEFNLEAGLSRDPDSAVALHFRTLGETTSNRWYDLPMTSIEKMHAYAGVLPDINEDMECFVSAERFRSATCRIRVYDPLVVEAVEVITRYPAYLELPDRVERRQSGDVDAPEGATVTLRVLANRPLKSGRLDWEGGASQPLIPMTNESVVATASFPVATNAAYRFRVEDDMGQVVESRGQAFVKMLPDQPPVITLQKPVTPPEQVTPLSELSLEAVANDDFGLAGVDLVYRCGGETEGPEQRIPLSLPAGAGGAEILAAFLFEMENVKPALHGGEVITWFLEARDRKKQTAATDLAILPVRYLDIWAVEDQMDHAAHEVKEPPSLAAILQSAFRLAKIRPQLAPRDFEKQVDDLALTMINAETKDVWVFVEVTKATPPQNIPKIKRVNSLAVEGHSALVAHQADQAVEKLRRAVMLMISMGLLEETVATKPPPAAVSAASAASEQQMMQQMETMANLEKTAAKEAQATPKSQAMEKADKTEAVQKMLGEFAKTQQKNTETAKALEKKAAEAAAKGMPPPAQQGARSQAAAEQQKLAESVQKAADQVAQETALDKAQRQRTAEAMRDAARRMNNAASEMKEGRLEKAAQEAEAARKNLSMARDEMGASSLNTLAEALARVESAASKSLRTQQEIARATQAAAKPAANAAAAARLERDLKALAARQAAVKVDVDSLQEAVGALKQAVESGTVRPETAAHIEAVEREMKRGRAPQKAVNAAVALAASNTDEASAAQQAVAATLEKVQAGLQRASDTMATGFEAELKRARSEAEQVKQALEEARKPGARQNGTEPEAARNALDTAARLARHLQAREFVGTEAQQALNAALKQVQEGDLRADKAEPAARALSGSVEKVRSELETAWTKLLENKKLFSAQREDCPPQYRPLVNQYFETLSGGK